MSPDLEAGAQLASYRIDRVIGRGGMGVVYLAEDLRLERRVALKVLPTQLASDESFRLRFTRESRMAAAIDHPNIIPVYDAGEADGVLYIAMRYVDGHDLREELVQHGRMEPDHALDILRQVAGALDAAHARGLVHRDVKPANIVIASGSGMEAEDHVYLTDFGLTKRQSQETHLTAAGQFVGTIDYVAPEQIEGRDVDGRTDEYSLACVLYECLTGSVPYQRDSEVGILFAHMSEPVPSLAQARPDLPASLDAVLERGMAKKKEERYSSCLELVAAFRAELGPPSGETPRPAGIAPPIPGPPPAPPAPPVDTDETAMATAPPATTAASGATEPVTAPIPPGPAPPPFQPPTDSGGGPRPPGPRRGLLVGLVGGGLVLAAVLAFVLLGGKGGDDGPGTTGVKLSHEQYQARLDSLDQDFRRMVQLTGNTSTLEKAVAGLRKAKGLLDADLEQYRTVNPPDDAAEANATLVDGLEQTTTAVGDLVSALEGGDTATADRIGAQINDNTLPGIVTLIEAARELQAAGYDAPSSLLEAGPSPSASASASASGSPPAETVDCSGVPSTSDQGPVTEGGQIFVARADGTGVARLTFDSFDNGGASWSPDCTLIAFGRHTAPGESDVFVMRSDGTGVRRLTDTPGDDGGPIWSPDGSRILFTSTRDGNREIYVMNADGSNETRLTNDPAGDVFPDWSNDGSNIVFASDRGGGTFQIFLMRADGSDVQQLTFDDGAHKDPSIAADNNRLAYSNNPEGQRDIFVEDLSTGDVTQLTTSPADDVDPAWSPDGKLLLFANDASGDFDLFLMRSSDGGDKRPFFPQGHLPFEQRGASFSPDGSHVAFSQGTSIE